MERQCNGQKKKAKQWSTKKEEFEDTKGVTRIRKLEKDSQHNGQKKEYKWTNNDL